MSKFNERPCGADDCNNWINDPELCQKCLDTSFSIELGAHIIEDECECMNIAEKMFFEEVARRYFEKLKQM